MIKESKKIVFVTAASNPWGAEHSLALIVQQLEILQLKPVIYCQYPKTAQFFNERTTAEVIQLEQPKSRLHALFSMVTAVLKSERTEDVVIFSLQLLPISLILRLSPLFTGHVYADIHDAPQAKFDRIASAFFACFCSKVIAISSYTASHLGLRSAAIVPRPIAPAERPIQKPRERITVGIVGRLDREKQVDLAISAVGKLSIDFPLSLKIYGAPLLADDGFMAELRELAAEFEANVISFEGTQAASKIYEELDILLVANANEPSGRTVGEAMMRGIPVVTPDLGGASEFFVPEESGLTFTAGSADSAGLALLRLASDAGMRTSIGLAGQARVMSQRMPEKVALQYANVLRPNRSAKEAAEI